MPTARDVMTANPTTVGPDESVQTIAQLLAEQDIGSVIVCDPDGKPRGMITDRDLAVGIMAKGRDHQTRASELLSGRPIVAIDAGDQVEDALRAMKDAAVRRLPVLDGDQVVGIVSQADLASTHRDGDVGEMVAAISEAPDNTNRG